MPVTLLPETKFFVPAARPDHIGRNLLVQKILQGLDKKITLIAASAGYGKTTLVTEVLANAKHKIAWVSLDAKDDSLLRFSLALVKAIRSPVPGFGASSQLLLRAASDQLNALPATLLNDMAQLSEPLILVLDDYHLLTDHSIDKLLAVLLDHPIPNLHLVITSREDPSLPLAKLRARGELTEIRAADLLFTEQETGALFRTLLKGTALKPEQAAALHRRTEGWIAGLQLAAISIQDKSDKDTFIERFTGSHRFVTDYLTEEVLLHQSDQMRHFMLCISLLDRFNADLCNALIQTNNAATLLRQLEQQNCFLIPLDENRDWFRFHHLFKDVLNSQISRQGLVIEPLHLRAALWFEKHDQPIDSIEHFLKAEQPDQAARVIELIWPDCRTELPESVYFSWMAALPEATITSQPVLSAHLGLGLMASDPERGCAWIDTTEHSLTRASPGSDVRLLHYHPEAFAEVPGIICMARAYQAGATGEIDAIVRYTEAALEALPENAHAWRSSAAVLLALAHWHRGNLTKARDAMTTGAKALEKAGELSGAISTLNLLANVERVTGHHHQAEQTCHKALKLIRARACKPQGIADLYITLAILALEQNQLEDAETFLQTANDFGPHAKLIETAHLWFIAQAQLEASRQRFENLDDLLDEAAAIKVASPAPDYSPIESCRARLHMVSGNVNNAEALFNRAVQFDQITPNSLQHFEITTQIKALIALSFHKGEPQFSCDQTINLLDRMLRQAERAEHLSLLTENYLLKALVHHLDGNEDQARKDLDLSVNSPDAANQAAVFTSLDPNSRRWLADIVSEQQMPDWLNQLDSPRQQDKHRPVSAEGLIEPLSERETEVLRMLATELSGPEIADRLFVSINTLRTHTKNLYSKLQVNNRRAAVRKAGELNIT